MNNWYIDRSKNFNYDTLLDCLKVFYSVSKNKESLDVNVLIEAIRSHPELNIAEGNINAALTRFRDHGLLRNNNIIGDSAIDYVEGRLSEAELVIDLFLKRPAKKSNSPNVKPFVLLCKVFDIMIEMIQDIDDIFITSYECKEYLCNVNDINEITYEYVEKIINERNYELGSKIPVPRVQFEDNEDTNFSILFNALNETPIFIKKEGSRSILRPNIKQKEFFKYISINSDEFSITPTDSKNNLYNYYCDRNTGINEVLPDVLQNNIKFIEKGDIKSIFEYLFGYKRNYEINYKKYFKNECFGIFFPFITLPGLPIRKIYIKNKKMGEMLYEYVSNSVIYEDYLRKFNEQLFECNFEYNFEYNNNIFNKSDNNDKMKEKFEKWLINKKLASNTVRNYLNSILITTKEGFEDGVLNKSIFSIDDPNELINMINKLNKNDKFNDRKLRYNYINSAALGNYLEFLKNIDNKHGNEVADMKIIDDTRLTDGYNKIVYGIPGCGKSWYVSHEIIAKDKNSGNIFRTTFYPDYTNSDFVGQIIPKINYNDSTSVLYDIQSGPFLDALIDAVINPTKHTYLIVEEINRGNSAAIFGDVFQLLDRHKSEGIDDEILSNMSEYSIKNYIISEKMKTEIVNKYIVKYDCENIRIPSNLIIIGTMNTSDQNVFTLDTAFKRRWQMEYIKNDIFSSKYAMEYLPETNVTWARFVSEINSFITSDENGLDMNGEDKQIGSYFISGDEWEVMKTKDGKKAARYFAEKVLSYLWDDVAKISRELWFNVEKYNTLENLIDGYVEKQLAVFTDNLNFNKEDN